MNFDLNRYITRKIPKKTKKKTTWIVWSAIPTEKQECYQFVRYLKTLRKLWIKLRFTHLKNEWIKTPQQIWVDTAMWLEPWVPDYLIILKWKLIFLEMKRTKNWVISQEQKERWEYIKSTWNLFFICHWFLQAKNIIDSYLQLK